MLLILDILCGTIYSKEVQYMNIDDWKSQIKRGTLDFCILLMIRQRPSYGYEIISTLEKYPILAAKENTIYPLLRRLMKEDNSKYSYDRIRDAYNAYSKLTEAEKVLVTNQAVLYEKISALEEELDEEIDFSKEYDSYKNAYKTDVEEAKPASTNWIVIVCSVLGGAMLIAAGILGFVILQKKRKQKERE